MFEEVELIVFHVRMLKHDRADYDAEEAMKEFEEIRKTLTVNIFTIQLVCNAFTSVSVPSVLPAYS